MQKPILSVIVCTYNREKYIGECLKHLADQKIDKSKYEVLVVNNLSTDNTQIVIDNIVKVYPEISFRTFLEANQGHTYARNRGISKARGEIISFLDDDAFVLDSYCEQTIAFFQEHTQVAAIGGKIIPVYEEQEPKWMSKYLLPLVAALDLGDEAKPFSKMKFPIGANMAFRASAIKQYGNFATELGRRGSDLEGGDEKEMFIRLRRGKENIWYVPSVCARHIIPPHRVEIEYIKGLAYGVGTSERKRLSKDKPSKIINKIISESIKAVGTLILSITYAAKGTLSKGIMLIKFRYWVVYSLLIKKL